MLKTAAFKKKKKKEKKSICTQTWIKKIKKSWVNLLSDTKVSEESTASSWKRGLQGPWWLCHLPLVPGNGFRTRLGVAGLACRYKIFTWIINIQTHTCIPPATSFPFCLGRAKKEFNPHREECTERQDNEVISVACSRNLALSLPHTFLSTAGRKAISHGQKLYTLSITNNILQGTSITWRA